MHINPINPRLCPQCGRSNQCAMELERATGTKQPPCWCTEVTFDATLLERIAPGARGKACLCADCAGLELKPTPRYEPAPGAV